MLEAHWCVMALEIASAHCLTWVMVQSWGTRTSINIQEKRFPSQYQIPNSPSTKYSLYKSVPLILETNRILVDQGIQMRATQLNRQPRTIRRTTHSNAHAFSCCFFPQQVPMRNCMRFPVPHRTITILLSASCMLHLHILVTCPQDAITDI